MDSTHQNCDMPKLRISRAVEKSTGMSNREILILIEDYLGVYGDGTIRGFSRAKHEAFYHRYCDLDVDVSDYAHLSTRKAMMEILAASQPRAQAKIIKGVMKMVGSDFRNLERCKEAKEKLMAIVTRLESDGWVEIPDPEESSETVFEALHDAEVLLEKRGPKSAVDRAHTALHGHLKALCMARRETIPTDPSLTTLFKVIRESAKFPEFSTVVPHDLEAKRVIGSLSAALDSLNTIRNRGTMAHPNELLLENAEAMLYINLSRAVLGYVDAKLSR